MIDDLYKQQIGCMMIGFNRAHATYYSKQGIAFVHQMNL